jgi:RND family efflux transporter MFP subunit
VSLAYYPGKSFPGQVSYIQPEVDPMSRTLKVRVELENPGMLLKPEMFADVEFRVGAAARLSVPVEAVLDSGRMKTVFVDLGDGRFEPRHVQTGERFGDRIEILVGLKAGERVVTSGNFLIDSESQLKAAASGMGGRQHD